LGFQGGFQELPGGEEKPDAQNKANGADQSKNASEEGEKMFPHIVPALPARSNI
jgi:hypothetical protein